MILRTTIPRLQVYDFGFLWPGWKWIATWKNWANFFRLPCAVTWLNTWTIIYSWFARTWQQSHDFSLSAMLASLKCKQISLFQSFHYGALRYDWLWTENWKRESGCHVSNSCNYYSSRQRNGRAHQRETNAMDFCDKPRWSDRTKASKRKGM